MRSIVALLIGILIGAIAVVAVSGAAGGSHGTYMPARVVFFPYTMLLAEATGAISSAGVLLALIRSPVYVLSAAHNRVCFCGAG